MMILWKKIHRLSIPVLIVTILLLSSVSAEYLKYYTKDTFVESKHPTIWRYDGTVSVRGADWIPVSSTFAYPTFSKITYSVPNQPKKIKKVDSLGPNDYARKGYITVLDSLNPVAKKTEVHWDIGLTLRSVNPGDPTPLNFDWSLIHMIWFFKLWLLIFKSQ